MCSLGLVRSSSSLLCSWTSSTSPPTSTRSHNEELFGSSRDTFFRKSPGLTNTVVTSVESRGLLAAAGRRTVKVSRCPSVGAKHEARAREQRASVPLSRRNSISGGHASNKNKCDKPSANKSHASLTASTSCLPSETRSQDSNEFAIITSQLHSTHISTCGRPVGRKRWKRVPEITSVRFSHSYLRKFNFNCLYVGTHATPICDKLIVILCVLCNLCYNSFTAIIRRYRNLEKFALSSLRSVYYSHTLSVCVLHPLRSTAISCWRSNRDCARNDEVSKSWMRLTLHVLTRNRNHSQIWNYWNLILYGFFEKLYIYWRAVFLRDVIWLRALKSCCI